MNAPVGRDLITRYWSRKPGNFVLATTGQVAALPVNLPEGLLGPRFLGTIREWYETLVETMINAQNAGADAGYVHKSELISCKCGPDVATILECSMLYEPNFEVDRAVRCHDCAKVLADEPIGTVSNRFVITIDRELPRDEIRKNAEL